MGHNYHSLPIDATIMVSKYCPITGEHVGIIFVTLYVTIATLWPAKNTLNFSFKRLYFKNGTVNFFSYCRILISRTRCNFWQSLKKFCTWGSEPPYIFENLRWLWTPCTEFVQTLLKVASHPAYQNSVIRKKIHRAVFEI